MVRRTASGKEEPDQKQFDLPSEIEHLFQVSDTYDIDNKPDNFRIDDPDIVFAKCEVVGGGEEGRTILIRCCLDDSRKEFFFTRMFLKVIGCEYKGDNFPINSDEWQGRQFYATPTHTKDKNTGKTYANIKEYNFDKLIKQEKIELKKNDKEEEIAWDEKQKTPPRTQSPS